MSGGVIVDKILLLGIIIAVSFIAVKVKYISADLKDGISKLIARVTLPLLVITTLTANDISVQTAKNGLLVCILSFLAMGLLYLFGILTATVARLKEHERTVHIGLSVFGNVMFLGYPLITALYGQEGLFYAIIYSIINDLLFYTVGVYALSGKKDGINGIKKLFNPNTISFIIALIMLAFKLRLPPVLQKPFFELGNTTIWISMVFIGIVLAQVDIKRIYKKWYIMFISITKLLLVPILIIFMINIAQRYLGFSINPLVKAAVALEAAMPAQTMMAVLSSEYNSDYIYAAECILVTTVFSLITLPFVYNLL